MGNSDHVQKKDVQTTSTQITHSQLKPPLPAKGADSNQNSSISNPSTSFNLADIDVVQPKLTIGEPNDQYEQEADRVASQVVHQIHSGQIAPKEAGQRNPAETNPISAMPVQRNGGIGSGTASTEFESQLNQSRGGGSSLEPKIKGQLETAMGADFTGVKIHTGTQADRLSQSIQAKAFTTGKDVFFKQGAYDPSSRSGQELIAHELTHVVQQGGSAVQRQSEPVIQRYLIRSVNGTKSLVSQAAAEKFLLRNKISKKNAKSLSKKYWGSKNEIRLATLLQEARTQDLSDQKKKKLKKKQSTDPNKDTNNSSKEVNSNNTIESTTDIEDTVTTESSLEVIDNITAEKLEAQDFELEQAYLNSDQKQLESSEEPENNQNSELFKRVEELVKAHSKVWNKLGLDLNIDNLFMDIARGVSQNVREESLRGNIEWSLKAIQSDPGLMTGSYSTICDVSAYLIMVMGVGDKAYKQAIDELKKIVSTGQQKSDVEDTEDPLNTGNGNKEKGKSNAFVTNYKKNEGDAFLKDFSSWAGSGGAGMAQFKGFSPSHTWVIEKTDDQNFIVYQAYQEQYTLGQMIGLTKGKVLTRMSKGQDNVIDTGLALDVPEEMVKEIGGGQKNSLENIKAVIMSPVSKALNGQGMTTEEYKKAFGAESGSKYGKTAENMVAMYFNYVLPDKEIGNQMQELEITGNQQGIELAKDDNEQLNKLVDATVSLAMDNYSKFVGKVKGDPLLKRYPGLSD